MNYFYSSNGGLVLREKSQNIIFDFNNEDCIAIEDIKATFNKVRPVFYEEMKLLNFDKYFKFDNSPYPFMWFNRGKYIYHNEHIATLKKYDDAPPSIVKNSNISSLYPINIELMNKDNTDYLEAIEAETIKKIEASADRVKLKNIVSFSGGKDSSVMLELCHRSRINFDIWFADTQFENADTYQFIDKLKEYYNNSLYIAKSHLSLQYLIEQVGYPSRKIAWCCNILKNIPLILKQKDIYRNNVFLSFVGVRKNESLNRSGYTFDIDKNAFLLTSKKQVGGFACYPLFEWSNADIWAYIFYRNIPFNNSYRYGLQRCGCIGCPKGNNNLYALENIRYKNEFNNRLATCKNTIDLNKFKNGDDDKQILNFMRSRINGVFLKNKGKAELNIEDIDNSIYVTITQKEKHSLKWEEWIKPLMLRFKDIVAEIKINTPDDKKGLDLTISFNPNKHLKSIKKYFKQAFIKSVYCIGCRACEAQCNFQALAFNNNEVFIDSQKCSKCLKCYTKIKSACLVYDSIKITKKQKEELQNEKDNSKDR